MPQTEIKRAIVPFTLTDTKALTEKGDFQGYGSTFGNVDFGGDMVLPGAFKDSLDEWSEKGQLPSMFWYHDMGEPVGDWLSMDEDEVGLKCEGTVWTGDKRTDCSTKAHNMITGTGPKGLSIGYSVLDSSDETVDGKTVRMFKKVALWEVSIVPFGMNPEAVITGAKSLYAGGDLVTIRQAERLLKNSFNLTTRQAKAFLAGGYDGLMRDAEDQGDMRDADPATDHEELCKSLSNITSILKG